MRSRVLVVAAFVLLAGAFIIDALTPQTLVIAILLAVPIVLAAVGGTRRLIAILVVSALGADAAAAVINAARDNYHWDAIAFGDRLLSMLSIVLVGFLSTEVQQRAERVGALADQEARSRRDATLSAAGERIRSSLSPAVVIRAIVREAPGVLEGRAAYWYPAAPGEETLAQRDGNAEVDVIDERPPPEILTLTHRAIDDQTISIVRAVDPVGRFVLDRLGASSALAVPFVDRGRTYGVLIVSLGTGAPEQAVLGTARAYGVIAINALTQARLFDELARRNEALNERQAVIRDLVYAISHDVRTPLAALSMTLRQAADGAYGPLPPSYEAVLRESRVSIDDLQRLAETLLLVARFESGDRRVERDRVDLAGLATEVAAELATLAQARRITLAVTGGVPAYTRGSRGDLRRALANLVSNSLQHTPEGGTVELRVVAASDRVDVTVLDDGYGVPPEQRAALFQRFAPGAAAGAGTGLGLYIVRRIAEETGGSARYAPRVPRGSVFTLSLPKAA